MRNQVTTLRVSVHVRTRGGYCAWNCPYAQRVEGASPPQTLCTLFRTGTSLPRKLMRDPSEGAFLRLEECLGAQVSP